MRDLNDTVAIVELGTTWGSRGRRQPVTRRAARLPELTPQQEVEYYVHWVHAVAFPGRLVLWISACDCEAEDRRRSLNAFMQLMWQEVQAKYGHAAVLINKCSLSGAKFGFSAGHGCKGPLLNVLAQILHATLLQVPKSQSQLHATALRMATTPIETDESAHPCMVLCDTVLYLPYRHTMC